jgi:hypothetical protein
LHDRSTDDQKQSTPDYDDSWYQWELSVEPGRDLVMLTVYSNNGVPGAAGPPSVRYTDKVSNPAIVSSGSLDALARDAELIPAQFLSLSRGNFQVTIKPEGKEVWSRLGYRSFFWGDSATTRTMRLAVAIKDNLLKRGPDGSVAAEKARTTVATVARTAKGSIDEVLARLADDAKKLDNPAADHAPKAPPATVAYTVKAGDRLWKMNQFFHQDVLSIAGPDGVTNSDRLAKDPRGGRASDGSPVISEGETVYLPSTPTFSDGEFHFAKPLGKADVPPPPSGSLPGD